MKALFLFFALCVALLAHADMVDTVEFADDAQRLRAIALAKSLRCPQCQNQNLVESNSSMAYKLRLEVYGMIKQGKSDDEIVQIMTDRFGEFVNYQPAFNAQTGILWGLPFGLVLLLLAAIVWRARGRT